MESYNQRQEDIFELKVDPETKGHLMETARWSRFLAILGYIMLGILIIFGIGMASAKSLLSQMPGGFGESFGMIMMVVYIALALLYFFPTYFLFKSGRLLKSAIQTNNQEQFNLGLSYQRRMFKFIGIVMIVILALYGLVILFAIIAGVTSTL
jgi:hypothetical protein